jgi:hypothetical protein
MLAKRALAALDQPAPADIGPPKRISKKVRAAIGAMVSGDCKKICDAPAKVVQADVVICDGSNLKGNSARAFEGFGLALAKHRQVSPEGSHGFPDGLTVVSREKLAGSVLFGRQG